MLPRSALWISRFIRTLRNLPKLVQIIGPGLHHFPELRHIFRIVVGGADAVALRVGQLPFDPVTVVALFSPIKVKSP